MRDLLLHFLGGLPEEHVGRDRGAEDPGDDEQERDAELDVGHEGGAQDLAPRLLHDQRGGRIGQQRQREPLQELGVGAVGDEDLQPQDDGGRQHRQGPPWNRDDERARLRDGGDVGADIDGVRDHHQKHDADQDRPRIVVLDDPGQALAGDGADPAAGLLDRQEQRDLVERRPQLPESELRARLRIGGDPGRIVIGGAGDQARAQHLEESKRPGPLPFGRRRGGLRGVRSARRWVQRSCSLLRTCIVANGGGAVQLHGEACPREEISAALVKAPSAGCEPGAFSRSSCSGKKAVSREPARRAHAVGLALMRPSRTGRFRRRSKDRRLDVRAPNFASKALPQRAVRYYDFRGA